VTSDILNSHLLTLELLLFCDLNSFLPAPEVNLNHKKIKGKWRKGQMSVSARISRISDKNQGVSDKKKVTL
jgi:hypothetical protein